MTASAVDIAAILARSDSGQHPDEISGALGISLGYVYEILREHRPKRKRKPRRRTSHLVPMIHALHAQGCDAKRIAYLLQNECARQYVYRVLKAD